MGKSRETLPYVRGATGRSSTINIDLKVPSRGSVLSQKKQAKFKDGGDMREEDMLNLIEEQSSAVSAT